MFAHFFAKTKPDIPVNTENKLTEEQGCFQPADPLIQAYCSYVDASKSKLTDHMQKIFQPTQALLLQHLSTISNLVKEWENKTATVLNISQNLDLISEHETEVLDQVEENFALVKEQMNEAFLSMQNIINYFQLDLKQIQFFMFCQNQKKDINKELKLSLVNFLNICNEQNFLNSDHCQMTLVTKNINLFCLLQNHLTELNTQIEKRIKSEVDLEKANKINEQIQSKIEDLLTDMYKLNTCMEQIFTNSIVQHNNAIQVKI